MARSAAVALAISDGTDTVLRLLVLVVCSLLLCFVLSLYSRMR